MGGNGQSVCQSYATVVAQLEHPAALLDVDGRIVLCNAPFGQIICPRLGVTTGQSLVSAFSGAEQDAILGFFDAQGDRHECRHLGDGTITQLAISKLGNGTGDPHYLCQVNLADGKRLQYLMDHLDQGVWDYDVTTDTFTVSNAWRRMRGIAPGTDVYDPGYDWLDDVHPDDQDALKSVFDGQMRGDAASTRIEYRHRKGKSGWVWILGCSKVVDYAPGGSPIRIVGTDTDITQVKQREMDLRQLESKLQLALDASGIGIWEFDPNFGTVHWDNRLLEIYGLTGEANDRSNQVWEDYLHPEDAAETIAYANRCDEQGLNFERDFRILRPDGEVRHVRSLAARVPSTVGFPKLVGVNIDMTEDRLRAQELEKIKAQLEYDSRHDALTGLANRRLLDETIAQLSAKLGDDDQYAVLHLDLDHFKIVNDSLGHAVGDALLRHVATAIESIIAGRGLTCRVGGDEFAVLFSQAPEKSNLQDICEQIVDAVREPFQHGEATCQVGISIGVAFGHGTVSDMTDVFRKADQALYAAKAAGRNCYRLYESLV